MGGENQRGSDYSAASVGERAGGAGAARALCRGTRGGRTGTRGAGTAGAAPARGAGEEDKGLTCCPAAAERFIEELGGFPFLFLFF